MLTTNKVEVSGSPCSALNLLEVSATDAKKVGHADGPDKSAVFSSEAVNHMAPV